MLWRALAGSEVGQRLSPATRRLMAQFYSDTHPSNVIINLILGEGHFIGFMEEN